jgi:hypothetical protein
MKNSKPISNFTSSLCCRIWERVVIKHQEERYTNY